MNFKASMDKTTKIITAIVIVILIALVIQPFIFVPKSLSILSPILTALILIIIFSIPILYKPQAYIIESGNIIIHRIAKNVIFLKNEIDSIQQIEKEKLKGSIRTFGVGGLFGYYGKFYNSKIGAMTWYASRRSNYVLITTTSNKKIILTPDNPENFVKEFYKR